MSTLALTPLGKSIAESTQDSGPEYTILSLMYETDGPVDFEEIMDATKMDDEKCSMVCRRLITRGYIKEI